MAGPVRRAYNRTVSAAKKAGTPHKLEPGIDAALIAAGANIANHLDGVQEELDAAVERARETLADAGPDDAVQVARALEAIDRISERAGKAVYLTPHLMNILREMHATPKSRAELLKESKGAKPAGRSKPGGGLGVIKGGRTG